VYQDKNAINNIVGTVLVFKGVNLRLTWYLLKGGRKKSEKEKHHLSQPKLKTI
jgi:hypothetical protein